MFRIKIEKNLVNLVILSKKPRHRRLSSKYRNFHFWDTDEHGLPGY